MTTQAALPSQARLRTLFDYDPQTGDFRWRVTRGCKRAGAVAGTTSKSLGYVFVGVDGVQHLAHRLAWVYVTGDAPIEVDHRDTCRSNNRWHNLRAATRQQNIANAGLRKNNTTGFKGVFKARDKFVARITVNRVVKNLGRYSTAEAAHGAYASAAKEAFGEFARAI